ncbi:alpha/beta fold hydrolase [Alcanivorax quisquiliarum]|uniref:Alpha/beta fold hydrolase n=1 Tax=Alcanivorax quisquiliarum TaxID=2933565 RepID=A0ABT0E4H2_9GAMM|nr:alpha/beta fold hydrolase [Alcanivorax quisquiliarum]MCK0536709.1 alpha/beta fold hydrolase [Alcanivorax quisquiliarum]
MAFLSLHGRPVSYRLLGDADKPLLILAHPLGMTQAVWDDMLPALLAQYRIITWDLPGHGASSAWPDTSATIQPEDLAQEALALAALAGAKRFAYAGTSIGGVIGQHLIYQHSHRLEHVTLTNTGAAIGTAEGWQQRADMANEKGLPAMAGDIVPRWFGARACAEQPALVDGWRVQLGRTDARSYALLCEMLGRSDFTGAFKDVTVPPTQLIAGSDDVATPPDALRALAVALGVAEPRVLEGIGHVPSIECPAQLAALLLRSS